MLPSGRARLGAGAIAAALLLITQSGCASGALLRWREASAVTRRVCGVEEATIEPAAGHVNARLHSRVERHRVEAAPDERTTDDRDERVAWTTGATGYRRLVPLRSRRFIAEAEPPRDGVHVIRIDDAAPDDEGVVFADGDAGIAVHRITSADGARWVDCVALWEPGPRRWLIRILEDHRVNDPTIERTIATGFAMPFAAVFDAGILGPVHAIGTFFSLGASAYEWMTGAEARRSIWG